MSIVDAPPPTEPGDVLELATDHRSLRALEPPRSIQNRGEIGPNDLAHLIAIAKRPAIKPGEIALRITTNEKR